MLRRPMDEAPSRSDWMEKNVPVAAGVMQDGLNAGVLLNLNAEALRAHAGRGMGRVVDVDGVHAELREQAGAFDLSRAVDAFGRARSQPG